VPGNPSAETAAAHGVRCAHTVVRPSAVQLDELTKLIDSGVLKIHLDAILPLHRAAEAQELNKKGHTRGKIVLQISGTP
jgi:NADPH:quinone reductase-like Zn-dependent oxidoreductase